ncbi:MAG: DUF2971 domain-containing protein [Thiobacillus sp.]|nr:DUF2971 domain-containing protein [Thiobacillus sp.]
MSEKTILYHYTSIAGLNSIISSGKVWASDCRYLNDRQELEHALDEAFNSHNFSRHHCVFSLSRSPQVLSQWRAYGDDGRGAAIGFDEKFLLRHEKSRFASLVTCIYKDHEDFVSDLVIRHEEQIEALLKMHRDSEGDYMAFMKAIDDNPKPLECLNGELLRIKNLAFAEEQEVRLVVNTPSKQIQTRVTKGLIVPYIEHVFLEDRDKKQLWIVVPEIWFGPKCDKRNMEAIGAFKQFGWRVGKSLHQYNCGYI